MTPRILFVALVLAACGCVNITETYAPPIQRKPLDGSEPTGLRHFIAMNDPNAPAHFIRDISETLEGGRWRWTGQRPTLRFLLESVKNRRFVMDFSVAAETFQQTGPITVSFLINGRLLERVRYDGHGEKHFEKPVDPSWLRSDTDNVVTAELDKVWVSPADGNKLGVVLIRAGFLE